MAAYRQDLHNIVKSATDVLKYECWGCEYLPQGKHSLLRVYIDSQNGIGIEDCEAASRQISAVLDVEDPIPGEYSLEVSSPGLDRPLFKLEHYQRFIGSLVKIKLYSALENKSRQLKGRIAVVEGEQIQIKITDDEIVTILFSNISKANLEPVW